MLEIKPQFKFLHKHYDMDKFYKEIKENIQTEGNMLTVEKGKSLFLINDDQEDDDFHLEFDLDTLNYPDNNAEHNEFNYLNLIVTDKSI